MPSAHSLPLMSEPPRAWQALPPAPIHLSGTGLLNGGEGAQVAGPAFGPDRALLTRDSSGSPPGLPLSLTCRGSSQVAPALRLQEVLGTNDVQTCRQGTGAGAARSVVS